MDLDDAVAEHPDPHSIAGAFGLRGDVGSLLPVPGAWTNRVFRLTVGPVDFAVKQLRNPWSDDSWQDWLAAAWDLEQRAIGAGVAAPEPIPNPANGACIAFAKLAHGSNRVPVRVHRWVAGTRPAPGPVDEDFAVWAGEVLALLHGLHIRPADRSLFPVPNIENAKRWGELVEAAKAAGVPWATDMEIASQAVETVAELVEAAGHRPDQEVMTHGDIDQKNVIVSVTGPVLCDWDLAAPLVPRREVADVALSLAAWERFDIASKVIASYRAAGGADTRIAPPDLGQPLMIGIDWLVLNIERALRLRPVTPDEAVLGERLVPELLAKLPAHLDVALRVGKLLKQ